MKERLYFNKPAYEADVRRLESLSKKVNDFLAAIAKEAPDLSPKTHEEMRTAMLDFKAYMMRGDIEKFSKQFKGAVKKDQVEQLFEVPPMVDKITVMGQQIINEGFYTSNFGAALLSFTAGKVSVPSHALDIIKESHTLYARNEAAKRGHDLIVELQKKLNETKEHFHSNNIDFSLARLEKRLLANGSGKDSFELNMYGVEDIVHTLNRVS